MKTRRTIFMVSFIVLISILVIFVFRWPWPSPSPGSPVIETTSLVLVRQTLTGEVLIRYVRGEQLHPEGTYVWKDQPVNLPVQEGQSLQPSGVPSAVLFPQNERIYVARAILDTGTNSTSIHIVDSGYATMLADSEPRLVKERPGPIDSPVSLTHINDNLLLAWREGNTLKSIQSGNGIDWTPSVNDIFTFPGDGPFALWSEGTKLYLSYLSADKTSLLVAESLDGITFSSTAMNASLPNRINSISIATNYQYVFAAYSDGKNVKVLRISKRSNINVTGDVFNAPPYDPDYKVYAVTIHPSPYGWALQYEASYLTSDGLKYTIFGSRSNDGLDYSGTDLIYNTGSEFLGGTSMSLTPVPMPWIIKTHDSGAGADAVYNFVITGDGFTYEEKDKFYDAAKIMTDNITNRAPFLFNTDLFNVWFVNTFSKDSGFDTSETINDKDTIFDGYRVINTNRVRTKHNGIHHARRIITGDSSTSNFYGFIFHNPPEGETVGIPHVDYDGIPMPYNSANSLVSIHEYLHTGMGSGGFALGDHELRRESKDINRSDNSTLSQTGSHNWQHWFVFTGSAPSQLVTVTDDYRNGFIDWVANNRDAIDSGEIACGLYFEQNFAYSENENSPHYVNSLLLFNVGLWESEVTDIDDFIPLYTGLRACAMNSREHKAQIFCPICSEIMVKKLKTAAGQPFDAAAFQSAAGAYLEFQVKNDKVCGDAEFPPTFNLEGLIMINDYTVPASHISTYESEYNGTLYLIGRVDLGSRVSGGIPATVVFKQQPSTTGETRLWIPGIQVLNSKGARYPMHPVGAPLIEELRLKHAPQCDYEYWDLSTKGDFTITFTPN